MRGKVSKIKRDLLEIFGDRMTDNIKETRLYGHDAASLPFIVSWVFKTHVDAIVQPVSNEELYLLAKVCQQENIPLIPLGSLTSGYGGALATQGGIGVDFRQMDKILELDREGLTVTVEPGVIWENLIKYLEDLGFTTPVYPSSAPSATVGGWVAQGGAGIGSAEYGYIQDNVVDIEIVQPNGFVNILSDMKIEGIQDPLKLYVGSCGILGLLSKIKLKIVEQFDLYPLMASFESFSDMVKSVGEIQTLGIYSSHLTDANLNKLKRELKISKVPERHTALFTFKKPFTSTIIEDSKTIIEKNNGSLLPDEDAQHEWEERLYHLRIKRRGPSLTPSEVIISVEGFAKLYQSIHQKFAKDLFAIEGSLVPGGNVVLLVYFLGDERRRFPFLFGWARSMDLVVMGLKEGGKPYNTGLWLQGHSREYFGDVEFDTIKKLKKAWDPNRIMNPDKVIDGHFHPTLKLITLMLLAPILIMNLGLFLLPLFDWLPVISQIAPLPLFYQISIASLAGFSIGLVIYGVTCWIPIHTALMISRPFLGLAHMIWR